MSRPLDNPPVRGARFPRVSGDEPPVRVTVHAAPVFSPRERG